MTSTIDDPTQTPEYKRAYKHHLKTKQPIESQLTPFRAQEKKYKSNFPPPDLDEVLDLWEFDDNLRDNAHLGGIWKRGNCAVGVEVSPLLLRSCESSSPRKAYIVSSHPGLVIIPAFVSHADQRALIQSSLTTQARSPNETNLDTHYDIPKEGVWNTLASRGLSSASTKLIQPRARSVEGSGFRSTVPSPPTKRALVENAPGDALKPNDNTLAPPAPSSSMAPITTADLLPKLRWANIGRSYHWGSKSYDFAKELAPFPKDVRELCCEVVRAIPWAEVWRSATGVTEDEWGSEGPSWEAWPDSYEPDAGIVNFYQTKDTLMGHVDRSEVSSTTPLVSVSLGNAAIFLIGGTTRDVSPLPVLLRSGDVVVMSGPRCRRAYHGVPRILEGTLPDHLEAGDGDWDAFGTYMKNTRININVRQVFPRGFVPPSTTLSQAHRENVE